MLFIPCSKNVAEVLKFKSANTYYKNYRHCNVLWNNNNDDNNNNKFYF